LEIISYIEDSFQEYEGRQSLVIFSRGCNLACQGCYNKKAVLGDKIIGRAKDIIDTHLSPMHEAVVFLGGEPTIWGKRLIESLRYVKDKGLETKIYSNGLNDTLIKKINKLNLADAWSIDFKCKYKCREILGKIIDDDLYVELVSQSLDDIVKHNIDVEVRTTLWDKVIPQRDEIEKYIKERYGIRHIFQEDFLKKNENINLRK